MTSLFGILILPEMLGLWVFEYLICVLLFYFLPCELPLLANLDDALPYPLIANALLLAFAVAFVGLLMGIYRPETCIERRRMLAKTSLAAIVSLLTVHVIVQPGEAGLDDLALDSAVWPLGVLLAWGLLVVAMRLLYTKGLRMNFFVRDILVVGETVAQVVDTISNARRGLFRVKAIRGPSLNTTKLDLKRLWGIVYVNACTPAGVPAGVRTFDFESFSENQLGRIDIAAASRCGNEALGSGVPADPRQSAVVIRRAIDILLASMLLLFTGPLLLITALLIRIESPGAVLYRQERVGLGGRSFIMWKFRSMRADAERLGPSWAALQDTRVTGVGRFIRKVRVDELPQLFNILRGEMSLVGPRPERPHFVEQLAGLLPLYRERTTVKPGLTGWAQVSYPYGASVEDAWAKLSYDLYYVKHKSLLFDLHIMLATVHVILFQEGAR